MKTGSLFMVILVVVLAATGGIYFNRLRRLYHAVTLFDADKIEENFRTSEQLGFPYRVASRGEAVARFHEDQKRDLPHSFRFWNREILTETHLRDRWATGLVVLKINSVTNASLLYENYWRGNQQTDRVISWSMGKSVVSALVGIAVEEGRIKSIEEPISDYVPQLKGSGYDGVRIKDVLQMSSGVAFNEDYFDQTSDIRRMGHTVALGFSINGFLTTLHSEREPGKFSHYVSMDTQALGWLLHEVLRPEGLSLTGYAQERLWKRAGFEQDMLWLLDNDQDQMELAFGALVSPTRDYARFGWLFANAGKSPLDGSQLVPARWVADSVRPDAPHLLPGNHSLSDTDWGYGYQWWLPGINDATEPYDNDGDFMAVGIYNQFIYVNPRRSIVIARNSAYAHYDLHMRESEKEALACFRAIAKAFVPL